LTLSALLLEVAHARSWKISLLGPDYSTRLYATIYINMSFSLILGIYLGIKRRRIGAAAGILLAWAWFLLGAINSVV